MASLAHIKLWTIIRFHLWHLINQCDSWFFMLHEAILIDRHTLFEHFEPFWACINILNWLEISVFFIAERLEFASLKALIIAESCGFQGVLTAFLEDNREFHVQEPFELLKLEPLQRLPKLLNQLLRFVLRSTFLKCGRCRFLKLRPIN